LTEIGRASRWSEDQNIRRFDARYARFKRDCMCDHLAASQVA
jgi:hypothetical protein